MPHPPELTQMPEHDRPETELIDHVLLRVRRHCEANAGRLTSDDLERLADIVLRIAGEDPDYPCRGDLEHTTQSIHSLDDPPDPAFGSAPGSPAPRGATTASLQALIARLLVAANIRSRRQREVARLYLLGHSSGEVAHALAIPRSTVHARWRMARTRLREALREIPPSDWHTLPVTAASAVGSEAAREAFYADERRPCYHPPTHCPAGRERCAATGICASRARPE